MAAIRSPVPNINCKVLDKQSNSVEITKPLKLILSQDLNGGISLNGKVPWTFKNAIKFTRCATMGAEITPEQCKTIFANDNLPVTNKLNAVIMGHETFKRLNNIPLHSRQNYVLTKSNLINFLAGPDGSIPNNSKYSNLKIKSDIDHALIDANENSKIDSIFFVGGAQVYNRVIEDTNYNFHTVYVMTINHNYGCDTFIDGAKLYERVENEAYNKKVLHSDADFTITEYQNKYSIGHKNILD